MQAKLLLLCGALPLAALQPTASRAEAPLAALGLAVPAAEGTISGTVLDEKGAGLPGVTVVLKGTTTGTSTDGNGGFTLQIPAGTAAPTLVISFVGYVKQEIVVGSQSSITVKLAPDTQDLSEVVVVGYGTQKRSDVTGSVVSVPQDRLEKLPVANVAQALQGAVAGVQVTSGSGVPGSQSSIQIRGVRSITANTDPYLIVDGLPFAGNLNDINTNDIASIEILKDASSTAIYGTRGSNGVILVTTKRGKTGKPQIRYAGYAGPEYIVAKLHPLNGPDFVAKYEEFTRQRGITFGHVPNLSEVDNYNAGRTVDWMELIKQQGFIQDHNVSISGGNDDVKYFVSGDYFKQQGIIKGYQYQRISFRTNVDANLTNWLRVGTSAFYANNDDGGGRANLSSAMISSPYANVYNPDGTYTIYAQQPEQLFTNPLIGTTTTRESRVNQLTGTGYAEVAPTFLPGLKYRLNVTYGFRTYRFASYVGRQGGDLRGTAQLVNDERPNYTVENILAYNKDIDKHHFDLTLLYSAQQNKLFTTTENASGFINDQIGFNSIGSGSNTPTISSYSERRALVSQMARLNYSYDSRYLFTATARRDGSSVFGANADKYATFPSVAVGWNIANEAFLKDNSVLNVLKLRFSYGTTGNEGIDPYGTITGNALLQYAYGGVAAVGVRANNIGNANLKWEQTTSANYAIDFGVLKNRITGSLEYYDAKTKDLLLARQIPIISGYNSILDNIGVVQNKGIELSLNTVNIQKADFSWSSAFNISANRNRLLELGYTSTDDIGNRRFLGRPLGAIYDYRKIGVWQVGEDPSQQDPGAKPGDLKFADLNGDKKIDSNDREYVGSSLPDYTAGLTNTFTYKGLSLRVFLQTAQGILKNNGILNFVDLGGRLNTPQEVGYWTPQNASNDRPGLNFYNTRGYQYPVDASYTRLKDVTLSYSLPAPLIERLKMGGISVYVSGRNLYTWTKWVGWDPEQGYTLGNGSGNVDNLTTLGNPRNGTNPNFPQVRTFVFGLNLTL
ncbi:SusC/RagA family TonB-linked outer membrane protein [Hymenobacter negativus]|uniref:TonB-dependent receptor n=1 Tax=Hymenobacter negativus TaxID=2795026 RepID=A0ABS0Q7A5_9BACT|nr:TonB-dependent receptor [Hymenobacter negativus]MBH8558114.1 TonB-dependent receptor [Hymenobacter negativus]